MALAVEWQLFAPTWQFVENCENMWCVLPPIQISQISQIPQISFEVFHGIPRKIIHCKLPKPAKPPTKYMQRELRKAQQLPQLAEEQQRRSPTFQDATRCDRKHKYMDYIYGLLYIYYTCYFSCIFYLCLRFLAYFPNGRIALSVWRHHMYHMYLCRPAAFLFSQPGPATKAVHFSGQAQSLQSLSDCVPNTMSLWAIARQEDVIRMALMPRKRLTRERLHQPW